MLQLCTLLTKGTNVTSRTSSRRVQNSSAYCSGTGSSGFLGNGMTVHTVRRRGRWDRMRRGARAARAPGSHAPRSEGPATHAAPDKVERARRVILPWTFLQNTSVRVSVVGSMSDTCEKCIGCGSSLVFHCGAKMLPASTSSSSDIFRFTPSTVTVFSFQSRASTCPRIPTSGPWFTSTKSNRLMYHFARGISGLERLSRGLRGRLLCMASSMCGTQVIGRSVREWAMAIYGTTRRT